MSVYAVVRNFLKRHFQLCVFCGYPSFGTWAHMSCTTKEQAWWDQYSAQQDAEQAEEDAYYAQLEEQEIQREDDEQHLANLMDSFCTDPTCYEEGDKFTGKCSKHYTFCWNCHTDSCVCADIADEQNDYGINEDEDDICEGDCGQPYYACTCAELASWKQYNATPMEERCGPWTA